MAISRMGLLKNIRYLNNITFDFRKFTTTSTNMEKAVENLKTNPYYEKYAARIADLQKTSPDEFIQRVEAQQKMKEETKKKKFASVDTRQFSSVLNPKKAVEEVSESKDKRLSDIFKLDLVKDKDATEIQIIWEEYHKSKEVISAAIPKDTYSSLQENVQQSPTFLFPLPRSQGYEFFMCQSYRHTVHFTPLLAYQTKMTDENVSDLKDRDIIINEVIIEVEREVHKENAPECLTMVHYTELADKGLVLMRGEFDKNVLNGQEARCLANQFQMYYSGKDATKLQLLKTFTLNPDTFKHMDLIAQLENISL